MALHFACFLYIQQKSIFNPQICDLKPLLLTLLRHRLLSQQRLNTDERRRRMSRGLNVEIRFVSLILRDYHGSTKTTNEPSFKFNCVTCDNCYLEHEVR